MNAYLVSVPVIKKILRFSITCSLDRRENKYVSNTNKYVTIHMMTITMSSS